MAKPISTAFFLFLLVLSGPSVVFPADFGSFMQECQRLGARVRCDGGKISPAGKGFGRLWGCYVQKLDVGFYVNSEAGDLNRVKNVKLIVTKYHGQDFPPAAIPWAKILLGYYGSPNEDIVLELFKNCPVNATFDGDFIVRVVCKKGLSADGHEIHIFPKK